MEEFPTNYELARFVIPGRISHGTNRALWILVQGFAGLAILRTG